MIKISQRIKGLSRKKNWMVIVLGLAITAITAGIYVFKPAYVRLLEYKLYDVFLQKVHSHDLTGAVTIVDIDEQSLERFGQWPWPRYRVALLLQKINAAGALAVGADILFSEPDGSSPIVMKKALKKDLHIDVNFTGMPEGLLDNDRLLANIISNGPFVFGYSFVFDKNRNKKTKTLIPDLNIVQIRTPGSKSVQDHLFEAEDIIEPLPVLLQGGARVGFMNTLTDRDGVLRRTPLILAWQDKIYPQLSLATLLTALGEDQSNPVVKVTRGGVESMKIGSTVIPLQANGGLMINYRGPSHTFPYISAGDILEDKASIESLKGKIVFLGTSAEGLKDIRISPLDQVYPGIEVHATIVDNILSNDFIRRPDWTPGLEMVCILFWGVLTSLLIGFAGPVLTLPMTLALGIGAWMGGVWALGSMNIWISPFFPILVLLLNFSILNLQKFWFSERKKQFFRSAFSKYVSKAVVDQLAENPEKLSLEGEEKDISILFSDIRGFTSISERLTPSQVTTLLHDYFTPITQIIIKNYGTHDKFIGDAVMCFWNAPIDVPNHEGFAIKAALAMLDALDTLNTHFEVTFGINLAIGIGLHSGRCRVGNMGSDDIFDYTIIGDSVNLASRLESLTKYYGVQLIISETMLKGLTADMTIQELDMVRVKGKNEPIRIFTVFKDTQHEKIAESLKEELRVYGRALSLYRDRAFAEAYPCFCELAKNYPQKKLYSLYQDRCAVFNEQPPGADWDGVFTHTSK